MVIKSPVTSCPSNLSHQIGQRIQIGPSGINRSGGVGAQEWESYNRIISGFSANNCQIHTTIWKASNRNRNNFINFCSLQRICFKSYHMTTTLFCSKCKNDKETKSLIQKVMRQELQIWWDWIWVILLLIASNLFRAASELDKMGLNTSQTLQPVTLNHTEKINRRNKGDSTQWKENSPQS